MQGYRPVAQKMQKCNGTKDAETPEKQYIEKGEDHSGYFKITIFYITYVYYYNDYSCNYICEFELSNIILSAQKGYFYLRKWATFFCAFVLYFLRKGPPILRNWASPVCNT